MKHFYLLVFMPALLFLSRAGESQPVINNPKIYSQGDTAVYYTLNMDNISGFKTSGAGVTWDFSAAEVHQQSFLSTVHDPLQTISGHHFHRSDYAVEASRGGVEGTVFYENSNDTLNSLGMARIYHGRRYRIQYYSPMMMFERPLTFEDSWTQSPVRTYYAPMGNLPIAGSFHLEADAYGTLELPGNTYQNVLRVKIEEHYFEPEGPVLDHWTAYLWFSEDKPWPVFRIDSVAVQVMDTIDHNAIVAKSYHGDQPVNIEKPAGEPRQLSPRFYNNHFYLEHDPSGMDELKLNIFDLTGRSIKQFSSDDLMKESADKPYQLSLEMLKSGVYLYVLSVSDTEQVLRSSGRFVIH